MNTDRFKFRVWDSEIKKYLKYHEGHEDYYFITGGDGHLHCDCFGTPIVEQCTGLRDKNGKLIYEGDIVVVPNTYPFYDYKEGIPHNDLNLSYGRIEHDAELNYIGIIEYDDEDAKFCLVLECVNPRKRGISSGFWMWYVCCFYYGKTCIGSIK